ncbi:unnamed protein product, partial [Rotaria sp. Silwood1]
PTEPPPTQAYAPPFETAAFNTTTSNLPPPPTSSKSSLSQILKKQSDERNAPMVMELTGTDGRRASALIETQRSKDRTLNLVLFSDLYGSSLNQDKSSGATPRKATTPKRESRKITSNDLDVNIIQDLESVRAECESTSTRIRETDTLQRIKGKKHISDSRTIAKALKLEASTDDLLLINVCSLTIGIEDIHGHMQKIICRNTKIPTRTQLFPLFTNAYAYQTTATIRIFEGEHHHTKYNTLLGEFVLNGLTTNFSARTLEISIRMDIDANGMLRVDAEESRSDAKASISLNANAQMKLSTDDIKQHLTYAQNDPNFAAKSIHDHKPDDPLYMLDGQIETMKHHLSVELVSSFERITSTSLLGKLKEIRFTQVMIEELFHLQSEDGSFMLNKDLADVLHTDISIFNDLENYLGEQGFNSLGNIT